MHIFAQRFELGRRRSRARAEPSHAGGGAARPGPAATESGVKRRVGHPVPRWFTSRWAVLSCSVTRETLPTLSFAWTRQPAPRIVCSGSVMIPPLTVTMSQASSIDGLSTVHYYTTTASPSIGARRRSKASLMPGSAPGPVVIVQCSSAPHPVKPSDDPPRCPSRRGCG